ncbi:hypothetical protein T439DRAFT_231210 [Meredithblackwellia eburnea MCA 4105]
MRTVALISVLYFAASGLGVKVISERATTSTKVVKAGWSIDNIPHNRTLMMCSGIDLKWKGPSGVKAKVEIQDEYGSELKMNISDAVGKGADEVTTKIRPQSPAEEGGLGLVAGEKVIIRVGQTGLGDDEGYAKSEVLLVVTWEDYGQGDGPCETGAMTSRIIPVKRA